MNSKVKAQVVWVTLLLPYSVCVDLASFLITVPQFPNFLNFSNTKAAVSQDCCKD